MHFPPLGEKKGYILNEGGREEEGRNPSELVGVFFAGRYAGCPILPSHLKYLSYF